jgi:hypothetical protein
MLTNRKKKYAFDGKHPLVLAVGGSDGHAGVYDVDVDEGPPDLNSPERKWEVTVKDRNAVPVATENGRGADDKVKQVEAVLAAFNRLEGPEGEVSVRQVREAAGRSGKEMAELMPLLENVLEEVDGYTTQSNGRRYPTRVLRRVQSIREEQ